MNESDSPGGVRSRNSTGTPDPRIAGRRVLQKWDWLHTRAHTLIVLVWTCFLAGQVFLWLIWEPAAGPGVKYLIAYSSSMLTGALTLVWWLFFAPFRWRTVLVVFVPVLLLIGGAVGSIRHVIFSGDMQANLEFRWDKPHDEVLEEHRRRQHSGGDQSVSAGDLPAVTVEDMPAYRGVNRDGVVVGPLIRTDWRNDPPTQLWRQPVGGGYSSFAIVGPRGVTLEQRRDDEAIVCYDIQTGRELWEHRYPAHFQEAMGGPGPRSTPTIHSGDVFALGALGDVRCLSLLTGEVRWHVNALKQFNLPNTNWAMASSPLVVDDTVIINVGGFQGDGLVAYRIGDGSIVWTGNGLTLPPETSATEAGNGTSDADGHAPGGGQLIRPGYASPFLTSIGGREFLINFDGVGLHGHDPHSGVQLWTVPFTAGPSVNAAQPIVVSEGKFLISGGYGTGSTLVNVTRSGDAASDAWQATELWQNNVKLRAKFSSPVLHGGFVYGLDEGIMVCLDPVSGQRRWKGGRYGHGQLLLTHDLILCLSERGELVLIEPSPEKLIERGRIQALSGAKTWNPPAMSRGLILVRNAEEMACYDLRSGK